MSAPRPAVSDTTTRLYEGLPEVYRTADRGQDGYPLLRFLSLTGDLLGQVEELLERIDVPDDAPAGTASDLVDPDTADPAWLPWLAQATGAPTTPGELDVAERRAAIRDAVGGWQSGTKGAIAQAARTALVYADPDGGFVNVLRDPVDPLTLRISTTPEETPSPAAVLDAILRTGAKPAGVLIVHTFYAIPWDLLESRYPTWAAIETTATTWSRVESTV